MQDKYKIISIIITIIVVTVLPTSANKIKYYVTIVDSDNTKTVFTLVTEPNQILENANVKLSPFDDYVMSDFNNYVAVLEIFRANQILINVDNRTYTVYKSTGNVRSAIEDAGIILNSSDLIDTPLNLVIDQNMEINITRVTSRIVEVDDVLPYETILKPTNTLKDGDFRILQDGKNGYNKSSTFQRLYDDEVISEEVLTNDYLEPINEIRLVGDSDYITSTIIPEIDIEFDENGNPINYIEKYTGKATAYSSLGKPTSLVPGNVAMNLSLVPRGSNVYVKTPDNSYVYGYAKVSDTGTALVEDIILVDLFFDSYLESCLFGAKEMEVYILQ